MVGRNEEKSDEQQLQPQDQWYIFLTNFLTV